jgi:hypothetical protein
VYKFSVLRKARVADAQDWGESSDTAGGVCGARRYVVAPVIGSSFWSLPWRRPETVHETEGAARDSVAEVEMEPDFGSRQGAT